MERKYLAPMEQSRWQITVISPLQCEMEHDIPRFGKAIFSRSAGRELKLRLTTHQRLKAGIAVDFLSLSPHWKSNKTSLKLASLSTRNDGVLLDVDSQTAKHAYLELQGGSHSGFYLSAGADLIDPTVVMMSTIRFRSVVPEFEQCINNLYFENFEDVRVNNLHFEHDAEFPLIEEEDAIAQRILDYLKVDQSINEIVVSGHADEKGALCYNDSLSQRRALYVYELLVSMGIDSKMISMDYYGERQPLIKGKNDRALAANRRVTIELRH